MAKPVILMDVDGVVADFVGYSVAHLASGYHPEQVTEHNICKALDLIPPQVDYIQNIWKSRLFPEGIPAYGGAAAFVRELRTLGDVYAVTAPMPGSVYWQGARAQWLKDHFGLEQVVSTEHKHVIAGDVMIDDNEQHLKATRCPYRILMARPWNKTATEQGWGFGQTKFDSICSSYEGILQIVRGMV